MSNLGNFKKLYIKNIPFYTNSNTGKKVLDAVLASCPEDQFVVAQTAYYIDKRDNT